MPKTIERPVPSSSVARLFDHRAAARAIAEPKALAMPASETVPTEPIVDTSAPATPMSQPKLVKRELVLTLETDEALNCLVSALRQATGTRLNASHVVRAMLRVVANVIPRIAGQANCPIPLRLPPKARGQEAQRDAFEQQLADLIASTLKGT